MPAHKEYTVIGAVGETIGKGDRVRVVFEGVVRSVDRDGRMVLKTPQGFFTQYDPDYQSTTKLNTK